MTRTTEHPPRPAVPPAPDWTGHDGSIKHEIRLPWRYFMYLFVPLALTILVIAWIYIDMDRVARREAIMARETARVNREAQVMAAVFAGRAADAAFLAARMAEDLKSAPDINVRQATALLSSFAATHRGFLQVRLLDANGRELIRFDNAPGDSDGPAPTPPEALQDKSETAYYKASRTIPSDSVHISRLDLNVEHGRIEEPYKPVLRFSSPVRRPDGALAGIIVLNLDAAIPLDRLRQSWFAALGRPLMANDRGFWLLGPSPDEEWGFQIEARQGRGVAASWPGVWPTILDAERGQFLHDGDLYTFDTVQASAWGESRSAIGVAPEEHWKIVARVGAALLAPPLGATFLAMTGGLLALLAGLCWLYAAARARRDMARSELAASEERFRAMNEASRDALIVVDDQGMVVFWNQAATSMFGRSREEVLGRPLHEFVVPSEELPKARQGLPTFAREGRGPVVGTISERTATRRDGTLFPIELSVAAFRHGDRWWAVGAVRDISARKEAEEQLRRLATTDGLTGLLNRRRFLELGQAEMERAARFGHPVGCVMFDVDHFKTINDRHGHDVGDAALAALAATALETLRGVDILGRLGGEEFAAILPETELDAAVAAAERLRLAVAAMRFSPDKGGLSMTISLGVAVRQDGREGLDALLKRADEALYRAKASGRDRVERQQAGSLLPRQAPSAP